jgi:hypothetical protein
LQASWNESFAVGLAVMITPVMRKQRRTTGGRVGLKESMTDNRSCSKDAKGNGLRSLRPRTVVTGLEYLSRFWIKGMDEELNYTGIRLSSFLHQLMSWVDLLCGSI